MTTEEKLENFYRHSIDSANAEAQRLVDEHQAALNQLFEEHKLLRKQQAEEEIAAETEKLKREANKALSAEQLSIKRRPFCQKHGAEKETVCGSPGENGGFQKDTGI